MDLLLCPNPIRSYNEDVKKIPFILSLGFAVIATIGLCTFVGYKTGHVVLGIVIGFILALGYLAYSVVKK